MRGNLSTMWHLCIQYADGSERILKSYDKRETALRCVDAIYLQGYPLHLAYIVREAATSASVA